MSTGPTGYINAPVLVGEVYYDGHGFAAVYITARNQIEVLVPGSPAMVMYGDDAWELGLMLMHAADHSHDYHDGPLPEPLPEIE